ncbi:MAG: alpha/beta fold hydrolase [Bacteriovoracaceae bacterium]|nr:alpha/beta fold hydrolase [Bacteriovoracaceae bacterium]
MRNPIWLLPGFLGDENHWGTCPDFIAHYSGIQPEILNWQKEVTGAENLSMAARYLAQRAMSEGVNPVLIGYSMGGRLALQALIEAPGTFSFVIAISAHPGFKETSEKEKRKKEDLIWAKLLLEDFDLFWEKWNDRGALKGSLVPSIPIVTMETRKQWSQMLETMGTGTQDFIPELLNEKINQHLLLIFGENDERYVEFSKLFPSWIEKKYIPQSAHRIPIDSPEELAQIMAPHILQSQAKKL